MPAGEHPYACRRAHPDVARRAARVRVLVRARRGRPPDRAGARSGRATGRRDLWRGHVRAVRRERRLSPLALEPAVAALVRRLDHSTIYVFIAASITPLALLVLTGPVQAAVLLLGWSGALAGIAMSAAWIEALGAWSRELRRRRLRRVDRASADPVARRAHAAAPARPRSIALHRRRRGVRTPSPRPVAPDVRLPRDLPRPRRRSGGLSLPRDGHLDRAPGNPV